MEVIGEVTMQRSYSKRFDSLKCLFGKNALNMTYLGVMTCQRRCVKKNRKGKHVSHFQMDKDRLTLCQTISQMVKPRECSPTDTLDWFYFVYCLFFILPFSY